MEYKKYILFANLQEARITANHVDSLMKEAGYIASNEVWDTPKKVGYREESNSNKSSSRYFIHTPMDRRTKAFLKDILIQLPLLSYQDSNPALDRIVNYRIYEYLNRTAKEKFKDYSVVPDGVDYIVDVTPKFNKVHKFKGGLLTCTIFYEWDNVGNKPIREVLKADEEWELANDSIYPATRSVVRRTKVRNFITTEDEYLEESKKITVKLYNTTLEKREEGVRRRTNLVTFMSEDFVKLRMLLLGESQQDAELNAALFLERYSSDVVNYKEGSPLLLSKLDSDNDPFFYMEIPDNAYMQSLYPDYIGKIVKDRISDMLKGLI